MLLVPCVLALTTDQLERSFAKAVVRGLTRRQTTACKPIIDLTHRHHVGIL